MFFITTFIDGDKQDAASVQYKWFESQLKLVGGLSVQYKWLEWLSVQYKWPLSAPVMNCMETTLSTERATLFPGGLGAGWFRLWMY